MIIVIVSYVLIFALGIVGGMCVAGLLANSRHNLDETQEKRSSRTAYSLHDEEL